jgi:hypothetical protein
MLSEARLGGRISSIKQPDTSLGGAEGDLGDPGPRCWNIESEGAEKKQ